MGRAGGEQGPFSTSDVLATPPENWPQTGTLVRPACMATAACHTGLSVSGRLSSVRSGAFLGLGRPALSSSVSSPNGHPRTQTASREHCWPCREPGSDSGAPAGPKAALTLESAGQDGCNCEGPLLSVGFQELSEAWVGRGSELMSETRGDRTLGCDSQLLSEAGRCGKETLTLASSECSWVLDGLGGCQINVPSPHPRDEGVRP